MNLGPRSRALLVLTAVVLGAHVVLLRAAPVSAQAAPVQGAPAMQMRALAAPAVEQAPLQTRTQAPTHRPAPAKPNKSIAAPATGLTGAANTEASVLVAAAEPPPRAQARASTFLVPDSMRLRYRVDVRLRGIPLSGDGLLVWRHDGSSYDARLEVSSTLYLRTQRSTGRITGEGLAPSRFSDKGRNEEAAHFEREKGKVTFSSNRPDAPLQTGAQDRLSVMLQLAAMIGGEPGKFPAGSTITIQTAGTRDAEPWIFTVEGAEPLELPGGKVSAIKITRNARRDFDQKVELWLAPGMAYAPVRLRLTQPNGDWVDQQWSSTDRG